MRDAVAHLLHPRGIIVRVPHGRAVVKQPFLKRVDGPIDPGQLRAASVYMRGARGCKEKGVGCWLVGVLSGSLKYIDIERSLRIYARGKKKNGEAGIRESESSDGKCHRLSTPPPPIQQALCEKNTSMSTSPHTPSPHQSRASISIDGTSHFAYMRGNRILRHHPRPISNHQYHTHNHSCTPSITSDD